MIRTPITVELAEKERGYRLQEIAKLNQAVEDLMKARDILTRQLEEAAAKLRTAAQERDRLVPEHQAVAEDMADWAAKGRADLGLPRTVPDEPEPKPDLFDLAQLQRMIGGLVRVQCDDGEVVGTMAKVLTHGADSTDVYAVVIDAGASDLNIRATDITAIEPVQTPGDDTRDDLEAGV